MRGNTPARPEQSQSPLEIIRDALRDAAVEPTPNGTIDVLGDALRRLADIAKTGVSHV